MHCRGQRKTRLPMWVSGMCLVTSRLNLEFVDGASLSNFQLSTAHFNPPNPRSRSPSRPRTKCLPPKRERQRAPARRKSSQRKQSLNQSRNQPRSQKTHPSPKQQPTRRLPPGNHHRFLQQQPMHHHPQLPHLPPPPVLPAPRKTVSPGSAPSRPAPRPRRTRT